MKHFSALLAGLLWCTASAHAFTVHLQVWSESCQGNDGAMIATPVGGTPPYSYLWNNASTASQITGLAAGTYSVTVVDYLGEIATSSFDLTAVGSELNLEQVIGLSGLEPCAGQCNGGFRVHLPRVLGGYSMSTVPNLSFVEGPEDELSGFDLYFTYVFTGPICDGGTVSLSAFNVCSSGDIDIPITSLPLPAVDVQTITGSCTGADDGNLEAELTIPQPQSGWCWWYLEVVDGQGGSVQPNSTSFSAGNFPLQASGMHPGDWFLEFTESGAAECMITVPVTVPDLGPDCATVSGVVHFETDVDCLQDGLEVGFPHQVLRITPGPLYGITATDGSYEVALPYGTYDLEQLNPDVAQLCPGPGAVPFTVASGLNAVVDLADSVITPFNMRVGLWNGISRVGFPFTYHLQVSNDNGYVGEGLVVTLDYDPLFPFVSATPGMITNNPGQIQWAIPALEPFGQRHLNITVQVPPDPGLLGNTYAATATTSTTNEGNLADNVDTETHTIVGSFDSNDKQAFTSSRTFIDVYLADVDTYIDYLIRFQNTGTDTAFNITVADTISPLLDMASLQVLGSSHPFTPSIGTGNVLRFTFTDILLPDSNVNEVASHGLVAFRLKPLDGILTGSIILNAADIYFDFNEPVRTNTTSLEVGTSTGIPSTTFATLTLAPVPATDHLNVVHDGLVTAITIRTLDGRIVMSIGGAPTIDVSRLTPGAYLLQAHTASGGLLHARFLKR